MGKKVYFKGLSEKEYNRQQAIANIKLKRMIAEAQAQTEKENTLVTEQAQVLPLEGKF